MNFERSPLRVPWAPRKARKARSVSRESVTVRRVVSSFGTCLPRHISIYPLTSLVMYLLVRKNQASVAASLAAGAFSELLDVDGQGLDTIGDLVRQEGQANGQAQFCHLRHNHLASFLLGVIRRRHENTRRDRHRRPLRHPLGDPVDTQPVSYELLARAQRSAASRKGNWRRAPTVSSKPPATGGHRCCGAKSPARRLSASCALRVRAGSARFRGVWPADCPI